MKKGMRTLGLIGALGVAGLVGGCGKEENFEKMNFHGYMAAPEGGYIVVLSGKDKSGKNIKLRPLYYKKPNMDRTKKYDAKISFRGKGVFENNQLRNYSPSK